jgi:hypothetical protein
MTKMYHTVLQNRKMWQNSNFATLWMDPGGINGEKTFIFVGFC